MEARQAGSGPPDSTVAEIATRVRSSAGDDAPALTGEQVLWFLHGLRHDRKRCRNLNSGHNLLLEATDAGLRQPGELDPFVARMVALREEGLVGWTHGRHDVLGDDLPHAAEFHLTERGRRRLLASGSREAGASPQLDQLANGGVGPPLSRGDSETATAQRGLTIPPHGQRDDRAHARARLAARSAATEPPLEGAGAANSVALLDEAARHIREHSLGEAARIGRLSRIREFVLGAQDGLLVPLGVVTGMAAAHPARSLIIVAGLAEAVAGAISMGGGSYLASEAEEQLYASEIAAEGREIDEFPERETAELALVLEREGLSPQRAETVARGLASNPNVFLRTKVEKELGLSVDAGGNALGDAVVVGATYLGAAIVPLWPYFFFTLDLALVISLACTLVALFAVGAAKGRITRGSLLRSGLKVLIIGSISAGVGFGIGHLVTGLAG